MRAADLIDKYLDELPTSTWGQSYNLLDAERRRELATKLAHVYEESGLVGQQLNPALHEQRVEMARRSVDMAGHQTWSTGEPVAGRTLEST
jgi:hypothetical protein